MRPAERWGVVAVIVLTAALAGYTEDVPSCPPDQVWGGTRCEWRDYCGDGTPRRNGRCTDEDRTRHSDNEPSESAERSSTDEQKIPNCPDGYILSNGKCISAEKTIICPDGKPSVNGKCPPKPRPCEEKTVFLRNRDATKSPRKILLVGGRASALFDRYIGDTAAAGRPLDLEKLTVLYYDEAGARYEVAERMTLGRYFNGRTIEQVWKRALRDIVAAQRPDAEIDARSAGADLLCGGSLPVRGSRN